MSELTIRKEILWAEDNLVIWIESALEKCDYGKPDSRDKLEESQFRNLVRVAESTESPEVIKNFIRYQVGRDKKWGRGKNSLAERIIQDIDGNLRTEAEAIAEKASSTEIKRIWLDLIRRYLGYGSRALRYRNSDAFQATQTKTSKKESLKGILANGDSSNDVTDELINERRKEAKREQSRS